jgi:hypothetical protein
LQTQLRRAAFSCPTATEGLRQAAFGIGNIGPLIYRNAEPSLIGDDVAETISGGSHNETADQIIFNH